jgi:addiction module HigA family antidote
MPMKNPPHPGWLVRLECLEPLGLSVTDAAKALGVSRNAMSELVNERRGISRKWRYALPRRSAARPRRGRACNSITTWRRP